MHAVCPAPLVYVPAGHTLQLYAVKVVLMLPAGQVRHVPFAYGEYSPIWHHGVV